MRFRKENHENKSKKYFSFDPFHLFFRIPDSGRAGNKNKNKTGKDRKKWKNGGNGKEKTQIFTATETQKQVAVSRF